MPTENPVGKNVGRGYGVYPLVQYCHLLGYFTIFSWSCMDKLNGQHLFLLLLCNLFPFVSKEEEARRQSGAQYGSFPGGFPGGMPGSFPGGMPGMGGAMPGMAGMPGLNEILSDPEVLAAMQDPEVMVAFQDVAQNPANMSKYQSNPKVMNLISKLSAKFGGQA